LHACRSTLEDPTHRKGKMQYGERDEHDE